MTNKINYWLQLPALFSLAYCFLGTTIYAQSNVVNKYGLYVVNDVKLLRREIAADSNKQMVNLRKAIPGFGFGFEIYNR